MRSRELRDRSPPFASPAPPGEEKARRVAALTPGAIIQHASYARNGPDA